MQVARLVLGGVAAAVVAVIALAGHRAPPYAQARAIVDRHCVSCHSEHPTVAAFPLAPGSVLLDTADRLRGHADRVRFRVAVDRSMPLLNKTGMTEDERRVLAAWVEAGAAGP